MIDWKTEVNFSLHKAGVTKELSYSDSIQLIVELYTKHSKSLLWFQNIFFENRVSWFGVRRLLLDEKVTLRSRGGTNRECFDCPIEELKTHTMSEISKKYNVNITTVWKRRKHYGVRGKSKPSGAEQSQETAGSTMDRNG